MLELDYLTGKDVQGKRRVRPLKTGRVSWSDKEFLALRAYCMLRRDERTFRVDRILALRPAPD